MAAKRSGLAINLIITALVLYLTSLLLGDAMQFSGIWGVVITAVVIGLLNFFIAPLISLLTCPLQILTLGLARFLVSGLMILLASNFLDGFAIGGFWWAVLAAIVISLLTSAVEGIFGVKSGRK